ncbi:N-6 DNA methylase [Patescibacteria group bacterium]|nr:N-6 DNA methylase [Patescibacteria group bacterium]
MNGIEKEINYLIDKFGIKKERAIILSYSLLLRDYFLNNLDKRYMPRIESLIDSQVGFRIEDYDIPDLIINENLKETLNNGGIDIIGISYNKIIDKELRKIFGKFYTPIPLVEHVLDSINLSKKPNGTVMDLACGAGVFLSAAVKRLIRLNSRLNNEVLLNKIIEQIYGIDIDATACTLAKLSLLVSTFPLWKNIIPKRDLEIKFNIFCKNSSLIPQGQVSLFKTESNKLIEKFDFVIGNPPYIEAKKLPIKDKKICRRNFPDIAKGAFDIYICFIGLGLNLLKEGGYLGFVLPNKFLVAKYASHIRKKILENYHLTEICDISNLKYFEGTDVYPILLVVKNKKGKAKIKTISGLENRDMFESKKIKYIKVAQEKYKLLNKILPFYCFEKEIDKKILFKLINGKQNKLSDFLEIKTTVSFHAKGLREKYVSKDIDSKYRYKYLGGKSYSRKNEVRAYRVEWDGYYINYDNLVLNKINNPLPPISNFEKPKIIFCQHAKRMLAYTDIKGEWVTKDVFPIAFLKDNDVTKTYYYTGFLNSKIFSFIYGVIYKGIQISEGYFHFLPSFLSVIPAPEENKLIIKKVAQIVQKLQKNKRIEKKLTEKIDKLFYNSFKLTKDEIARVEIYNKKYLNKFISQ